MDYNARYYHPALKHFISPDTIIPNPADSLAYDRYAYVNNNPVMYNDPSGHLPILPFLIGVLIIGAYVAHDVLTVAPAKENRAPEPTSKDMTGWLVDRINENATAPVTQALKENFTSGDPVKVAGATKAWVSLVRTGGNWDYKTDINSGGVMDANHNIMLCGEELNFQAIANIHYGAAGRAAGVPESVLEAGAGAFQIYDNRNNPNAIGTPGTYFDDPYDNWMIGFGSWLYDQYGDKFGHLTQNQLEEAWKKYSKVNGSPGKPAGEK